MYQMQRYQLSANYPQAWRNFRNIFREDEHLLHVLRQVFGCNRTYEYNFTVHDVGCGDASLSAQCLSDSSIFAPGNRPQQWNLIEPLSGFSSYINTAISSMNSSISEGGRVDYNSRNLSDLLVNPMLDISGLVLSIHSSYYFSHQDIAKLQTLKNERGHSVFILENNDNCWVSKVMKHIGNYAHPQFQANRLKYTIENLGYCNALDTAEFPLPPLVRNGITDDDIDSMVDFFFCCDTRIIGLSEKIRRLRAAFMYVMDDSPVFSYSYAYIHPQNAGSNS
jgi:hypothetical protein